MLRRSSPPGRFGRWISAALAIGALALPAAADVQPVSGRVVGENGQPVTGVQVSRFWAWNTPEAAEPSDLLAMDGKGNFSGELEFYGREVSLVAYSEDFMLAGIATVKPNASTGVKITLEPSVEVSMRITCSDLGGYAGWVNSYWGINRESDPLMATARDGVLGLRLPRSEVWHSWCYGRNIRSVNRDVTIEPGVASIDLGETDFKATYIALNVGRQIEDWTVTDARGLPVDKAQIRDLKGKWVLVGFW